MSDIPLEVTKEVEDALDEEADAWFEAALEEFGKESDGNSDLGKRPEPPKV